MVLIMGIISSAIASVSNTSVHTTVYMACFKHETIKFYPMTIGTYLYSVEDLKYNDVRTSKFRIHNFVVDWD